MDHFHYRNRVLHCEDVPVRALAENYGTPLYVYSKATLLHHLQPAPDRPSPPVEPLICYSIKTNGNLHICRLMVEHGAGFDVTSGGELYRALKAGGTRRQDRLRRRRQDRRRVALRPRKRRLPLQRRERGGTARPGRRGQVAGQGRRGGPARQPRPAAQDARQDRHQRQGRQVRPGHRHRPGSGPAASSAIRTCKIVGLHMHLGSPILSAQPYREGVDKGLVLIEQLRAQGHPIDVPEHGRRLRHPLPQAGGPAGRRPSPRSSCRRCSRRSASWSWSRAASSSATPASWSAGSSTPRNRAASTSSSRTPP